MFLGDIEVANLTARGIIFMWNGAALPSGWVLCDGNNGTPNMINRFVKGDIPANYGITGGNDDAEAITHGHTFTGTALADHLHAGNYYATVTNGCPAGCYDTGGDTYMRAQSTQNTTLISAGTPTGGGLADSGSAGDGLNMPEYYSLAYIMRTGDNGLMLGVNEVTSPLPDGIIAMTAATSIPVGWFLCDGNNGTPNLVDKFIRSSDLASVGGTGGSNDSVNISHSHTFTWSALPAHEHANNYYATVTNMYPDGHNDRGGSNLISQSTTTFTNNATEAPTGTCSTDGVDGAGLNQPPFYVLAYMMKGA